MSILDLLDMKVPETVQHGSNKSNNRCGGGGGGKKDGPSALSLLLC